MKTKPRDTSYTAAGTPSPSIKRGIIRREPTHNEISAYAKAHWEKSGCPDGQDMAIWLEAERRLRSGADLPSADDDAQADTRDLLGEASGTIEDRLEPFGDKGGDRSPTSL